MTGGGSPSFQWPGRLGETGEQKAGNRIIKGGVYRGKLCNIAQVFNIEMAQRGGNH